MSPNRAGSPVSGTTKRCVNCGRKVKHPIIDWTKHYVWCAGCWREYLIDFRSAHPESA